MKFFRESFEIIMGTVALLALLFVIGLVLRELAPIITILVVLLFTLHTFERRTNALLAIVGIILYAVSWRAVHYWGVTSGQLMCFAGIMFWFSAIFRSFGVNSIKIQEFSN